MELIDLDSTFDEELVRCAGNHQSSQRVCTPLADLCLHHVRDNLLLSERVKPVEGLGTRQFFILLIKECFNLVVDVGQNSSHFCFVGLRFSVLIKCGVELNDLALGTLEHEHCHLLSSSLS